MCIKPKVRKSLLAALVTGAAFLCAVTGAHAGDSENSTASEKISLGTMSILLTPAASIEGMSNGNPLAGASAAGVGSGFIVTGIVQGGGDSVQIVLNGIGNGAKISVNLSKSTVQTLALSTGTVVQMSVVASGTILIASGKVIAFIPNQLGEALLYQSRLSAN